MMEQVDGIYREKEGEMSRIEALRGALHTRTLFRQFASVPRMEMPYRINLLSDDIGVKKLANEYMVYMCAR